MYDFHEFAKAVHARFVDMSKDELFVTANGGDKLFQVYLDAFPEGTNPIYKTRTEHDCSCCKNFIRNLGSVVTVKDGKVSTIWDYKKLKYPFKEVAKALHDYVMSQPVETIFRAGERSYGAESSKQLLDDGTVHRWSHFYGSVATRHYGGKDADAQRGTFNTAAHVFKRGLEELSSSALVTVFDLIDSKSLYRGEEHLPALRAFKMKHDDYAKLDSVIDKQMFVFQHAFSEASRFRNTVIGTLVQDLSAGVDIEGAVRSFEQKVAPTNYKRTTALITPAMVKTAMKTISDLGLESALNRRLARLSDVSVNNVLWVDNAVKSSMKDGVESILMSAAKTEKKVDPKSATDISIDDFMKDVLPKAVDISMKVQNTLTSNFMTLTAPVEDDVAKLFKWDNNFGWSYDGNITDTIRERVKAAGGNVNAKFRISLSWYNHDDLDIHVTEPNGNTVYFANRDGKLDVDMNAGRGTSRTPVENVSFTSPLNGHYEVYVNQYNRRDTTDGGFTIEIADDNGLMHYSHKAPLTSGKKHVGTFTYKNGVVVEAKLGRNIDGVGISQNKWGVKTEDFVKVKTVMFSPNYWDDNKSGNKHWFFILEGCKCDLPTRGIYNEFLSPELEKHRKVFEVLGDKTKCPVTDDQLSGLGFSSTRNDTVLVSVKTANSSRVYNIKF